MKKLICLLFLFAGTAHAELREPKELRAQALSSSEVKLTWGDRASDEEGYLIQRKIEGKYREIARTAANAVAYIDSGLNPLTEYSYKVRAFKGDKTGDSQQEEVKTLAGPPPTPAPPVIKDCDPSLYGTPGIAGVCVSLVYNAEGVITLNKAIHGLPGSPQNVPVHIQGAVKDPLGIKAGGFWMTYNQDVKPIIENGVVINRDKMIPQTGCIDPTADYAHSCSGGQMAGKTVFYWDIVIDTSRLENGMEGGQGRASFQVTTYGGSVNMGLGFPINSLNYCLFKDPVTGFFKYLDCVLNK